jgi:hypothetical protein
MKHVKLFESFLNEAKSFQEAVWKMDKWMPEEETLQMEYYDILNDEKMNTAEKVKALASFIEDNAYMDVLSRYLPAGSSAEKLAQWIVDND